MASLEIRPASIIAQLQDLLRDRYRSEHGELPLIKEIVQNADDAGSQSLRFVLFQSGFVEARNSLLHGPALVCINDGRFSETDEKAIRSFGLTRKAEEVSSVGRFGVGQKSVFHLAESYIYLGRENPQVAIRSDVVDPWANAKGDPAHPDWFQLSEEDRALVLHALDHWTSSSNWLALYLPLRLESHRRARGGLISTHFPRVERLERDLADMVEMGYLLPHLHHLRRIETISIASPGAEPCTLGSATWNDGGTRLSRPGADTALDRPLQGEVELALADARTTRVACFGRERCSNDRELHALQRHSAWPHRAAEDAEEELVTLPEKALPHGATIVIRAEPQAPAADTTEGELVIGWAVFLPLSGGHEQARLTGVHSIWRVLLHGYFFPDSGRRGIFSSTTTTSDGALERPEQVRAAWNDRLRDRVTLSTLLPAIAAAFNEVPPTEAESVARALANTNFWREHRIAATADAALVWGPSPTVGARNIETTVRSVSSVARLLPLPRPNVEEAAEVHELLACWHAFEQDGNVALVWRDGPSLCPQDQWDKWSDADARSAFKQISWAALKRGHALSYFASCLQSIQPTSVGSRTELLELVRRCFSAGAALTAEGGLAAWRSIVNWCPREAVLWSKAGVRLLRALAGQEHRTRVLLLPSDLRTDFGLASQIVLSLDDARLLLRFLTPIISAASKEATDAESVVAEVVSSVSPAAVLRDEELRALPVFRVWSARKRHHVVMTAEKLDTLIQRGAAFGKKGAASLEALASKMLEVVDEPSLDVVLVDDEVIADAMNIEPYSEALLARYVEHAANAFADEERRFTLFTSIVAGSAIFSVRDPEAMWQRTPALRNALRLLIHGDSKHRLEDLPLFLIHSQDSDANYEVLTAVLNLTNNAWRVVPRSFAQDLSRRWMDTLGVESLADNTLIDLMRSRPGDWRVRIGAVMSAEARDRLRRVLAMSRADDLFGQLAIHDSVDGSVLLPGGRDVYLENPSWAVPRSLAARVRLIRRDVDPLVMEAQRRVLPPEWCAIEQIAMSLDTVASHERAEDIMDGLLEVPQLSTALHKSLRAVTWLPTAKGTWVRPNDVFNLPDEVVSALAPLLSRDEPAFVIPTDLGRTVRNHKAYEQMIDRLALGGRDAVAAAAQQLDDRLKPSGNPFWLVPGLARAQQREFLERGSEFRGLAEDPAWRLVAAVRRAFGEAWFDCAADLLDVLRKAPSADRAVTLLNRFANLPNASDEEKDSGRLLFEVYLKHVRQRDDFVAAILPKIHLLDASGAWRPTMRLARSGTGLLPQFQVDEVQRRIVGLLDEEATPVEESDSIGISRLPSPSDVVAAAKVLEGYFASWRGVVSDEALGYFIACLGDGADGAVRALSDRYLSSGVSTDGACDKLFFELGPGNVAFERGKANRAQWAIEVLPEGVSHGVVSMAGTALRARVSGAGATSLFVGAIPLADERSAKWLRLRHIDPGTLPQREMHEIVGTSLARFLASSVRVELQPADFQRFWSQLAQGAQSKIEAVRAMMLDRLVGHLESLGGRRDELLRGPLQQIARADQRFREVVSTKGLWDQRERDANSARRAAHEELRALVEKSEDAQRRILHAIRKKLDEHQYSAEQVLFELFQNADDAASDLVEMRGRGEAPLDDEVRGFEVEIGRAPPGLRVRHWGRLITQLEDARPFPEARARGFDLDLQNMLVLHLSEKDESSTGRFGLGFKSVHLLTERPRVRSGDLSFEIRAGLLPVHVPLNGPMDRATVVDLPLSEASVLERAVGRFGMCSRLLPMFARTIRRVVVHDGGRSSTTWAPTTIAGLEEIEIGLVPSLLSKSETDGHRMLVLRGRGVGPTLAIAFTLGEKGVQPLAADLPDVWCTVPVERWGLGFCLSGPFTVDAGRAQLARAVDKNRRVFERLGDLLGRALEALCIALEQRFTETSNVLGIESLPGREAAARTIFWQSMFELLTEAQHRDLSEHQTTLLGMMHADGRGLSGVIASQRVLPTGLPGEFDTLTTVGAVRWVLDEVASRPDIFACLANLGGLGRKVSPGSVISARIEQRLQLLGGVGLEASRRRSFAQLLESAFLQSDALSPEKA